MRQLTQEDKSFLWGLGFSDIKTDCNELTLSMKENHYVFDLGKKEVEFDKAFTTRFGLYNRKGLTFKEIELMAKIVNYFGGVK